MTTETKVEAVALWVPNGHTLRDGSWEDGPGDLVRIDEASDFQKLHGFPLVPASAITALKGEVERAKRDARDAARWRAFKYGNGQPFGKDYVVRQFCRTFGEEEPISWSDFERAMDERAAALTKESP